MQLPLQRLQLRFGETRFELRGAERPILGLLAV